MNGLFDFRIGVPGRIRDGDPMPETGNKFTKYDDLYGVSDRFSDTLDSLLEEMDRAGIEKAALHAEYVYGDPKDWNARTAEAVRLHPDRFIGIGTVDPGEPRTAVSEASRCFEEYGFAGINLQPCYSQVPANDRRAYLVYAVVQQHDGIVTTHSGVNFFPTSPIRLGSPLAICDVACDLPDLKIVACHGGWPWGGELAAVAWKHPNVYFDFGAISPKYLGRAGAGYETLWNLAQTKLSKQILFGTDWPTIGLERVVTEFEDNDVTPEKFPDFFYNNAARLLGQPEKRFEPAATDASPSKGAR